MVPERSNRQLITDNRQPGGRRSEPPLQRVNIRAMVANAQQAEEEKLPVPPPKDSVAASEISLYRNVLKIRKEHGLENLGIAFYDAETTIQWAYNGDHYFHAASTMKLAVLLGVMRQVERGELTLD